MATRTNQVRPTRRHDTELHLDEIDRSILRELVRDARVANNELAAHIGVAPSTCLLRVRRLVEAGAITGFHAAINPEFIGYPLRAIVSIRLHPKARQRIRSITEWLSSLPRVQEVLFLAGPDDFQLHVAASSPDALRSFVVDHLSSSADIASTQTALVFEQVRGSAPIWTSERGTP